MPHPATPSAPRSQPRRTPRLQFRLQQIRKERGLTLRDVSGATGITSSGLSDLETGRHAMPSDETLVAICDGLGIQPGDLLVVTRSLKS